MTTKLGIGSYAFAWSIGVPGHPQPQMPLDALGFVQQCAALGVKLVQIADNLPLHSMAEAELDALHAEVIRLGLSVEVGTRGIAHDHLLVYLELAQRFASPILRVVIDTAHHHPDPPEIVATLRDITPAFEATDVILAIENHDRFKASELAGIVQQIGGDHIGICLDTVNSFGALEGPEVVVGLLRPYVVNLHVKDFRIVRAGHNMGFDLYGTPAGEGMLDVPWLIEKLDSMGRSYNAILELWPAPEADIAATCAKELDWARESIDYLRTLIKG